MKLDVHRLQRRLDSILQKIKNSKDISEDNRKEILCFYSECSAQGLSIGRISKLLHHIFEITLMLKKNFKEANREEIVQVVQQIESNAKWSLWTKHDYKVVLKKFYKWLRNSEDFPDEVKWIKSHFKNDNHRLPEELLTEDEVRKLVEASDHPRDKALLFVLYESGCRIGELLNLKIRNISFDQYGAILLVNGKTGQRRVRIISSAPLLSVWLNNHPFRENPDSRLWIVIGTKNHHNTLTYSSIHTQIRKIAKRAGIRKKVNPHAFRHARATHLANKLTEAQMKEYFGWVQSSDMASVYVHLSGRDVDNALLKLHGMVQEDNVKEDMLKIRLCPRCNEKNSPVSKFCCKCGSVLDVKTALEIDEKRKYGDEVISMLAKDSEIQAMIIRKAVNEQDFREKLRKMA